MGSSVFLKSLDLWVRRAENHGWETVDQERRSDVVQTCAAYPSCNGTIKVLKRTACAIDCPKIVASQRVRLPTNECWSKHRKLDVIYSTTDCSSRAEISGYWSAEDGIIDLMSLLISLAAISMMGLFWASSPFSVRLKVSECHQFSHEMLRYHVTPLARQCIQVPHDA